MPDTPEFFFDSLKSKEPRTTRQTHIRRLYDIMQLCLQRNDIPRARKAWAILIRCKEINWKSLWVIGLKVVGGQQDSVTPPRERLDYLRATMLQHGEGRELVLQGILLQLIQCQRYRDALDELELYLPSVPYQDNPVLHSFGGMLSLFLAQPADPNIPADTKFSLVGFNPILLKRSQVYFERARALDAENAIANMFLDLLQPETVKTHESEGASDNEVDNSGDKDPRRKKRQKATTTLS